MYYNKDILQSSLLCNTLEIFFKYLGRRLKEWLKRSDGTQFLYFINENTYAQTLHSLSEWVVCTDAMGRGDAKVGSGRYFWYPQPLQIYQHTLSLLPFCSKRAMILFSLGTRPISESLKQSTSLSMENQCLIPCRSHFPTL